MDYFIVVPDMEADSATSVETTQEIHNEYINVFTEIGCFKGTFSLQVKDDINHISFHLSTKLMHHGNH